MLNNGYFSHTGLDGSTTASRLRAGGVSFSWSGENICYYNGLGLQGTLEWCHATFMSEPYPGVANHIGNILSAHYNRLGVGIAPERRQDHRGVGLRRIAEPVQGAHAPPMFTAHEAPALACAAPPLYPGMPQTRCYTP